MIDDDVEVARRQSDVIFKKWKKIVNDADRVGNQVGWKKDKDTNDYILIAESGIKNSDDIKKFNSTGIYNFLIGESLLKSKDKEKKIGELLLNDSY